MKNRTLITFLTLILFNSIKCQTQNTNSFPIGTFESNLSFSGEFLINANDSLNFQDDELRQILTRYNKYNKRSSNHALFASGIFALTSLIAVTSATNIINMDGYTSTFFMGFTGLTGIAFSVSSAINKRKAIKYLESKL